MEKSFVYIIYSQKIDKFYFGAWRMYPEKRKERHLSEYYGATKFTAKADDWILFFELDCISFSQALKIENHIKLMNSKKYIQNLMEIPEMGKCLV